MCLFQQKLDLINFFFASGSAYQIFHALIISADDLLTCSLFADLIIDDTISCHVDTHICRRFVRALTHDLLKHSLKNREDFYITIVVNGSFAVCFQMEWIDHVDIV